MKKTLAIALALIAAISMLCTTAFAGQGTIAPASWDGFEFNLRKADPANVIKDGKIGTNEYDEIKIDNEKAVYVNYTVPDDKDFDWEGFKTLVEDLKKSMKVFVSWDETNGFNIAIQYHVPANELKGENPGGDESFVFTKLGGVLIQIRNNAECTPLDDPEKKWADVGIFGGNVIYDNIGWNTVEEKFLHCLYQAGYQSINGNKHVADDANYGYSYDEETETVTFEASYPLNQVIREDDPNKIYVAPSAMRGKKAAGTWGDPLAIAVFGETGFYVKQETITNQRCMTLNKIDEAVGYVEPDPTPTPEPTPIISVIPGETITEEVVPMYAWIIMGAEAVLAIALLVALILKKK